MSNIISHFQWLWDFCPSVTQFSPFTPHRTSNKKINKQTNKQTNKNKNIRGKKANTKKYLSGAATAYNCNFVSSTFLPVNMGYWKNQWRNRRGGGARGQSTPTHFWPGNFCWPSGKREARNREIGEKDGGKLKMEGGQVKSYKMTIGFLLIIILLSFFLFIFHNQWNLFWVCQNGNFLPRKTISRRGKNEQKWLCSLWIFFPLTPLDKIYDISCKWALMR